MNCKINRVDLPKPNNYKYFDFPKYKIEILVFCKSDGKFSVLSSFCPHFGGPLEVRHDQLFCPFHGYKFNLETGECLNKELGAKCQFVDYFIHDDGGLMLDLEVI